LVGIYTLYELDKHIGMTNVKTGTESIQSPLSITPFPSP